MSSRPRNNTRYIPSSFGDYLEVPTSRANVSDKEILVQAYIRKEAGLVPVGHPKLRHQFYRKELSGLLEGSVDGLLYFADILPCNAMVSIKPEAE